MYCVYASGLIFNIHWKSKDDARFIPHRAPSITL